MEKSFDLQFMEELDKRCELNSAGKFYLYNMGTGHEGEINFQGLLRPQLPSNWRFVTNKFFDIRYNRAQMDAILIAPHRITVFEVKNLKANYIYEDEKWTTNDNELTYDYFDQVRNTRKIIRIILQENNIQMDVQSKLMLINEFDTVDIRDNVDKLYLKRWHLQSYVQDMKDTEKTGLISANNLTKVLMNYATERYIPDKKPWNFDNIYNGIVCDHCRGYQFDTKSQRVHIICRNCGYKEVKEIAVLRTICELGILYYDKPLTKKFILSCMNDNSLKYVINHIFEKYFKVDYSIKNSVYINPMRQIEYAFPHIIKSRRYNNGFVTL